MNPKLVLLFLPALMAGCSLLPPDMRMGAGPAPAVVAVTPFTSVERDFAVKVAAASVYEIEVSKLAVQKGMSTEVRNFAQTMVTHHTQMNNELVMLMSAHGVAPPSGLAADKSNKLHRLAAVRRGDAFDSGYVRVVGIEDHRNSIATFEKMRSHVRDRDLRAFIERSLVTMRMHLAMAQNTAAAIAG